VDNQRKTASEEQDDANARAIEVIRSFDECMLVSLTADGVFHARPMALADAADDGHLTFITGTDTPKAREIDGDERVIVTFQGGRKFATLRGRATLQKDRSRLAALWKPAFQAWFKGGPDDPNAVLVEVSPESIEVWDASGLKGFVALFERAKAAVTNEEPKIPPGTHDVVDVR